MLHAIIMAGGSGTRFWPLSRALRPKQLLDFAGGRTMIQATVDRFGDLVATDHTWIITNRILSEAIAEQLPQVARERIVGEPCKRDTAPAIGLAAMLVSKEDPEATMVVCPSDHLIQPAAAFQLAIRQAAQLVDQDPGRLITFGIKPTYPAESFGYIERGKPVADGYEVLRFREKPAKAIAEEYLAAGNFYWNSGIFVWKAKTILEALQRYEPDTHARLKTIGAAIGRTDFAATLDREFTAIRGKSIDFAVMEHYRPVIMIEAPFRWDDVGSWQAIGRVRGHDETGNTFMGKHIGIRTSGSMVRTSDDHLVVTLGVDDLIVVHTPDATLVAGKDEEEAIREVVKALEERGWRDYL